MKYKDLLTYSFKIIRFRAEPPHVLQNMLGLFSFTNSAAAMLFDALSVTICTTFLGPISVIHLSAQLNPIHPCETMRNLLQMRGNLFPHKYSHINSLCPSFSTRPYVNHYGTTSFVPFLFLFVKAFFSFFDLFLQ